MVRRAFFALPALVLFFITPTAALAWGSEGHRIIAHLAYERLTPKARAEVAALIAHSADQGAPSCPVASLEDAATWPDCIRPLHGRWEYLAADHYEDVPVCLPKDPTGSHWVKVVIRDGDPASLARAESVFPWCKDGKCIVAETARAEVILKDPKRSPAERLQALEEIAHFIGDMHQPLHAADNGDRGGNEVRVTVPTASVLKPGGVLGMLDMHPGRFATNLHHVWDVEVLTNTLGPNEAAAEAALRPLVAKEAKAASNGDLNSWLMESHALAISYVYPKLAHPPACGVVGEPQEISQAYLDGAAPMVREQLAKAAVRLARALNDSLR